MALGDGQLGAPGAGVVLRAVDAVVDRDGTGEGRVELLGAGDVDAAALDQGVLGAAARPGQQPHLLAGPGQLQRDGRADGTGPGDDVDGVHDCSSHWESTALVSSSMRPLAGKSKSSAHLRQHCSRLCETPGMTDTTTPRARARQQTMRDIVRIGRSHLATDGAAALSLRAVARDLGVVSSAVYRYVGSRDELLTLLVVDGYDELGDAVDAALTRVDPADHGGRLRAIGRAVRAWALAEPATYALLFGSPVPGYTAPAERTTGPGTRVIARLAEVWEDAWVAGAARVDEGAISPRRLSRDVGRIRRDLALTAPDELIARGVLVWAALFGCVSFEVFGQYGPDTFTSAQDLFEHHLEVLAATVGLA